MAKKPPKPLPTAALIVVPDMSSSLGRFAELREELDDPPFELKAIKLKDLEEELGRLAKTTEGS